MIQRNVRVLQRIKYQSLIDLDDFPFQNQIFYIFYCFTLLLRFQQRKVNNSHLEKRIIRLNMSLNYKKKTNKMPEVWLHFYFFSKCVKSLHHHFLLCTLLTHSEKNVQNALTWS